MYDLFVFKRFIYAPRALLTLFLPLEVVDEPNPLKPEEAAGGSAGRVVPNIERVVEVPPPNSPPPVPVLLPAWVLLLVPKMEVPRFASNVLSVPNAGDLDPDREAEEKAGPWKSPPAVPVLLPAAVLLLELSWLAKTEPLRAAAGGVPLNKEPDGDWVLGFRFWKRDGCGFALSENDGVGSRAGVGDRCGVTVPCPVSRRFFVTCTK